MVIARRHLNSKRKSRSNTRRNGFGRNTFFENNDNVKPKGSISKILEKYLTLAQDANSNGDKIKAEGYYQYAEHYQRIINSNELKKPANIDKKQDSDSNKSNELSRTQRAINGKLKRFENKKTNKPISNDESLTATIDSQNKTSDGVEALKAFGNTADEQE